jgi:Tol biopolymer transport system component
MLMRDSIENRNPHLTRCRIYSPFADRPRLFTRGLVMLLALLPGMLQAGATAQDAPWQVVESVTIETEGYAPVLSPDGRWVAGLDDVDDRHVCVWEVASGEQRCNEESSRAADASLAWSPDSRSVAFSQNGAELDSDIFVLDVANNSLENLTEDEVDDLKAIQTSASYVIYDRWPVWSADGAEILFTRVLEPRSENGQRQVAVSRVIVETGQVLRGQDLLTDEPLEFVAEALGIVLPPVWLADGTVVLAIRGGQDIAGVYAYADDARDAALAETDPAIRAANVPLVTGATADGGQVTLYWLWGEITIGGRGFQHAVLDRETGELTPITPSVPQGMILAGPPRLSPDGTAIVYAVTEDEQTLRNATVRVQDLASGEVVEIAEGVSMQFWEGVRGLGWTAANQVVVPLDNGGFEVITLSGG